MMRRSTHERILTERIDILQRVHDELMMGYIRQVDGQMMRLRQIQDGEIERLRTQIDRLEGVGQ